MGRTMAFAMALALAVAGGSAAEDVRVYQGAGFSIQYPDKHSKLLPPSAAVPFQLEYRKNSLLRLETERLTQPIDLADDTFAQILQEVQLERLKERVPGAAVAQSIRRFPWGVGLQFDYELPARSGKRGRKDRVVEIVTTVDETLYRFTHWVPERDLKKSGPPIEGVVESFAPERRVEAVSSVASPAAPAEPEGRFSVARTTSDVNRYRADLAGGDLEPLAEAALQASLAEALGWKGYLTGPAPEELEEMRRAAEAAVEIAPSDVDSRQARAWVAYHESRMGDMEEEIQEALAIAPDDAENHLLYALWYGFNPERAEEMAERALEADPESAAAMFVKASADRKGGDLQEARAILEEAIRVDPGFTRARLELGDVLEEAGEIEAAVAVYRAAVAATPSDPEVRFRSARALRRSGRIDEAVSAYLELLALAPDLPEAHYNLAVLYLNEKQSLADGKRHFERFVALAPDSERADRVRRWLNDNR